jgi:hypothetical protein
VRELPLYLHPALIGCPMTIFSERYRASFHKKGDIRNQACLVHSTVTQSLQTIFEYRRPPSQNFRALCYTRKSLDKYDKGRSVRTANLSSYSDTITSAFKSCFRASNLRVPLRFRVIFLGSSSSSFALDRQTENRAVGIAEGEEDSWAFKRTVEWEPA